MNTPHPSIYIREELVARRWTRNRLALEMGGTFGVNRLMIDMYFMVGPKEPNMRIGDETAEQFAHAFGTSKELFLNLENAWLKSTPQVH
jgi:plasmid maintenance system antidote protein VapI